jgi:D-alanine--D-alanine ligase
MIAILQGGHESEAEISRMTSQAFQEALDELGYEYCVLEYSPSLSEDLIRVRPNICLNAMHGKFGEDGTVQALLRSLKIPYTGSGVEASGLSFDKVKSLQKAMDIGVPVLQSFSCAKNEKLSAEERAVVSGWSDGFVVKPSQSGSSRGVTLCDHIDDLSAALVESFKWDERALVEKRLKGREVTVSVFQERAFDVIEIRPKTGFYDMENKYTKGATDYLTPAPISEKTKKNLQEYAVKIFKSFGLKTYGRVDFLMEKDESAVFFMEVNTLPGCTPTSLLPKALAYKNIPFTKLIQTLLDEASF